MMRCVRILLIFLTLAALNVQASLSSKQIAVGANHFCIIQPNKQVFCSGKNSQGALGDGTTTSRNFPVIMQQVSSVADVSAGPSFTCVVESAKNRVRCSGRGNEGQVGEGRSAKNPLAVVAVRTSAIRVVCGGYHACALLTLGRISCWGQNKFGALGALHFKDSHVPASPITIAGGVVDLAAGQSHTCVVTGTGKLMCAGRNQQSQLGDGTIANRGVFVYASALAGYDIVSVGCGLAHTCVLAVDGTVLCWGKNNLGQVGNGNKRNTRIPFVPWGTQDTRALAVGFDSTCVIQGDARTVKCFGTNNKYQLGTSPSVDKVMVATPYGDGVQGVQEISMGKSTSCIITPNAFPGAFCVGDDAYGQLGNGAPKLYSDVLVPVKFVDATDRPSISPTARPTTRHPSPFPTSLTKRPSMFPTHAQPKSTLAPSMPITTRPTLKAVVTAPPSQSPTKLPTTLQPTTLRPTTVSPTSKPTSQTPTQRPTSFPTMAPVDLSRPNIIIALADDMGFGDVGFTERSSNLAKTPNLDNLAFSQSSWVFTNFHSEAACSPSRIAILTGRAPLRNCVLGSQIDGITSYNSGTRSIAQLASEQGYRTLFLGKFLPHSTNLNAESDRPSQLGFQDWTTIEGGSTYDFACICRDHVGKAENCFIGHESPATFLKFQQLCFAQSSPDGHEDYPPVATMESEFLHNKFHLWLDNVPDHVPFFAQLSFRSVHVPFVASPELRASCASGEICNPTPKPKTSIQLDYAGCVYGIDQTIGKLRDSIQQLRPHDYDNTIFIFTSDNGPAATSGANELGAGSTGGYKGTKGSLYEGLLRMPTLIHWPRAIRTRQVSDSLAFITDIPATLSEAISGEQWPNADGMSFYSNILSGNPKFRRSGYSGVCGFTSSPEVIKGLACPDMAIFDPTGRWKLIADRTNTNRMKDAKASEVSKSTAKLYDLWSKEGENKALTNTGPRALMIEQANLWLADVFGSFRESCKGYY